MTPRANGIWVIVLSFLLAFLLAIVPFPEWAMHYRPQWVALVLIYWMIALPYRVGMGTAWVVGAFVDILEGSMLGLNALAYTLIAYLTLNIHHRLRMFSYLQQSALVLVMVGLSLILVHWIKVGTEQSDPVGMLFLLSAVSSAFVWPWLFVLLRQLRRGFDVQ